MRHLVSLFTSCLVLVGCAVEHPPLSRTPTANRATTRPSQPAPAPIVPAEAAVPAAQAQAGETNATPPPAEQAPLAVLPPLPGALRANADLLGLMRLPPNMLKQLQVKSANLSGLDGQAVIPGTSLINLDGGSLINLDGGSYRLHAEIGAGPLALGNFLEAIEGQLGSDCENPFSPPGRPPLMRELAMLAVHGPMMRSALAVVERAQMRPWYFELPIETPLGLKVFVRQRFVPKGEGGTLYIWMKDLTDDRFKHHATVVFDNARSGQIFTHLQVPTIGLVVTKARFGLDDGNFSVELASFPDGQGPKLFELPLTASFWTMRHAISITRHKTPQPDGTVVTYRSVVTNGSKYPALKCVDMRRITVARFLPDQRGAVCTRRFAEDGLGEGYTAHGDTAATNAVPVAAWYLDQSGEVLPAAQVDAAVQGIRFEATEFEEADVPDLAREHNANVQTLFQVPAPPPELSP